MVSRRGANSLISVRGVLIALFISPRICRRPLLGLRQRRAHDFFGDAVDLDIHLQRS